jgi:formate dehydrogenase major subunit
LPASALLRDDGSTACGCWIFAGAGPQAGNQMGRRDNSRPDRHRPHAELGVGLAGQPPHPVQPRLGRPNGKPWDPTRKLVAWNGTNWGGADVPDIRWTNRRPTPPVAVHHDGRRRGAILRADRRWPKVRFPEHYEPFESPIGNNPLHPNNPRPPAIRPRACSRATGPSWARRTSRYVATSYR